MLEKLQTIGGLAVSRSLVLIENEQQPANDRGDDNDSQALECLHLFEKEVMRFTINVMSCER